MKSRQQKSWKLRLSV